MNTTHGVVMTKDTSKHPCFNKKSSGSCGRVHLPVAPKCNIQCNYCNRKYDCVNESRPGVTSTMLSPEQAVEYMADVLAREPRITVAGIAGPGDPMANAAESIRTMRLLNERFPHIIFCLSSNGLGLPAHLDDLVAVGVSHVTVTVNAVDPVIGAKMYSWVRDGKVVYRGRQAAELLLSRQMEAVRGLKERGIIVKVNTILVPGVNDDHILAVSEKMSTMGVDIQNVLPLKPTAGTPFGAVPEPDKAELRQLRALATAYVPQMTHCRRCRADAVGMLCKDQSQELAPVLKKFSAMELPEEKARPYVAVASREGMLVNVHLGEAKSFQIWEQDPAGGFRMVEKRIAPKAGGGPKRWLELAKLLGDCRAVLASALGETPRAILEESGVTPYPVEGFIDTALATVYGYGNMDTLRKRAGKISGGCDGRGGGCG